MKRAYKHLLLGACSLLAFINVEAQTSTNKGLYNIDVSGPQDVITTNHLHMGTRQNPQGDSFDVNSLYFIKNGKPWYPVMGEFHFVRLPKSEWESSIVKMKSAGVDIIATYIFWIYHEEQEGIWDWQEDRDLKQFVALCAKHQMYVWLRIGPWCHGEVRNGGLPDWLLTKSKIRSEDPTYIKYTTTFFQQIHQQVKDYYFKQGGTVLGVQIENEFGFNSPGGLAHMLHLKRIAVEAGIDVPYYSATYWPRADLKQTEMIPAFGAYPEAPWSSSTKAFPFNRNYLFRGLSSDENIGADLLGSWKADTINRAKYQYPYATAEMGGGIQITHHRRPIIKPEDVLGMAYTSIGSGANLIGYYMFHGGSNKIGKFTTLQESKKSKYPNDYPIISYDFQSPLGEWAQLQPSFFAYKKMHYFLNNFGDLLVNYKSFFPNKQPSEPQDDSLLRWSVRSNGTSGFVFINHFQRLLPMQDAQEVQFRLHLSDHKDFIFPKHPTTIPNKTQAIFPFKFSMDNIMIDYALAQPFCVLNNTTGKTYVFTSVKGITPELLLDAKNIRSATVNGKNVKKRNNQFYIKIENEETARIRLTKANNQIQDILVLNHEDALYAWHIKQDGKEVLMISKGDILNDGETISFTTTTSKNLLKVYPASHDLRISQVQQQSKRSNGLFSTWEFTFPEKSWKVEWSEDIERTTAASNLPADTAKNAFYPLYSTSLSNIPGAKYYQATIPKDILNNVENIFMHIDYEGDTQAAYLNNELIADNFYNGLDFIIGLKRFRNTIEGKRLELVVTPLKDPKSIFLEIPIAQKLSDRKNIAAIKSITFKAQYKAEIKL